MTRDGKTQTFQNETREVISHEKEVSVNAVRVLPMCRAPRGTFSTHLSSHLAFETPAGEGGAITVLTTQ